MSHVFARFVAPREHTHVVPYSALDIDPPRLFSNLKIRKLLDALARRAASRRGGAQTRRHSLLIIDELYVGECAAFASVPARTDSVCAASWTGCFVRPAWVTRFAAESSIASVMGFG